MIQWVFRGAKKAFLIVLETGNKEQISPRDILHNSRKHKAKQTGS